MEASQPDTVPNAPTGALFKCLAGGLALAAVVAFMPYGAIANTIGGAIGSFISSPPAAVLLSAVGSGFAWVATLVMMDLRVTWFILFALTATLMCVGSKINLSRRASLAHMVALGLVCVVMFVMIIPSAVPGVRLTQLDDLANPNAVLRDRFIDYPAQVTGTGCEKYVAKYASTPALVARFEMLVDGTPVSANSCQMGKFHNLLLLPRSQ